MCVPFSCRSHRSCSLCFKRALHLTCKQSAQVSTACRAAVQQARSDYQFTSTDKQSDINRQLSTFLGFAAWLPRYPGMLVEMELQLETHPQRLQIAHAVTAAMANCSTPAASAATKSSADRTATCGQHLSHTHVPLKLRSFTADCQLVNATVLQSLDADIWSCYLRSFEMRQATPAFCGALGRLTGLHELTLVPSFGQGALPTAAVAALPRLPALRHLELAIKPSAVHLLPASLVLLTAVLTGSSDACGGASHSNPTASVAKSSSARTAVVDVSHMDRLAELQSRAPGGGRFTIKVPDYIVTVGAKHPVRYLTAAMRTSTSGARDQQDPERQITGPAALAAAAQTISERKHGLKVLWMRLILPQVEDFAVLQDLQLEELSDLKLSLGFSCGDTVQLEQGPQQQLQLQRAAASLSRCTHISDLFFSVSGQENPSFVGSIPWCQSIAQLMRLRKLDLIMDWMQPDDLLQLSVLTLLTYLALGELNAGLFFAGNDTCRSSLCRRTCVHCVFHDLLALRCSWHRCSLEC